MHNYIPFRFQTMSRKTRRGARNVFKYVSTPSPTSDALRGRKRIGIIWILLLLPVDVFAKAPECPLYANKTECLSSVEENYRNFLDFIDAEEEDKDKLIQAAADIKKYEVFACQKTCLN